MQAALAWFLIICGLHFFAIMICDAVIRSAIADRLGALFLWKFSFAFLRGMITGWLLASWVCLFRQCENRRTTRRNGSSTKKLTCKRTDVNAATITRQSKSNLALAFISLGRERKRDIIIFYAFCRVIDDIADSAELTLAEKELRLAKWRQMLQAPAPEEPLLAQDVRLLIEKYSLPVGMFEEIIAGVEMDLSIGAMPLLRSSGSIAIASPVQLDW